MTGTRRHLVNVTGASVLALVLLQASLVDAQVQGASSKSGRTPITTPFGHEPGIEGSGPVWHEDPDRVEAGTRDQIPPDQYLETLERTGLWDMLQLRTGLALGKSTDHWTRVGPLGGIGDPPCNGRISGIQIVAVGTDYRVYAGACQGGLWWSQGSTLGVWNDIGRNLPIPSVRAFHVYEDDQDHIIVGTGDHRRSIGGGMFVTQNGGATWAPVPLPVPSVPTYYYRILHLGTHPTFGNEQMVLCSTLGPFYSDNGGVNWYRPSEDTVPVSLNPWTDIVQHPDNDYHLYGVCCNGDSDQNGIYRSYDYGETWTKMPMTGLPTGVNWSRASLGISRSAPSQLVLMLTTGNVLENIYKSTNGAQSWDVVSNNLVSPTYTFGSDQAWHAQAVAIDPQDEDRILIGAVGLALSDDGGASWLKGEQETGIIEGHADFTQLYFSDLTGPDTMWMCNDGGLFTHDFTTGTTVSVMGNQLNGLACSEIDYLDVEESVIAIGLQDNGIMLSVDAGQNWELLKTGDGADVEIFDPVAGDLFLTTGYHSLPRQWRIYRKQFGEAWDDFENPGEYMPRMFYSPHSDLLYTHTDKMLFAKNAQAEPEAAWDMIMSYWQTDDYNTRDLYSSYSREPAFWVTYWKDLDQSPQGDEDLTYLYQEGETWQVNHFEDFNTTGERVTVVKPSREWPDEAWVGLKSPSGSPKIFHLRDGGNTVENITGTLNVANEIRAIEVMPFNPDVIWAGTDLAVYRSVDGGQTWDTFMNGLPIGKCTELRFVEDPNHTNIHSLYLATDGRGVWKRDIATPPIVHVDARMTISGDGSRWRPFRTVAEAVAVAPAGALIAICSDTYVEPQTIDKDVRLVTWRGSSTLR